MAFPFSTVKLVTAIQNETELASLPSFTLPLRTTPSNDDLAGIYRLALQYQIISATVTADGDSREETFSVAWDFSAIDQTALGEYTAVGRIELPEGYAFGENVLRELQIPVRVEEMPPVVITSVEPWYPYTDAFALPQVSEMEALEELFAFSPYHLECYAENGNSYTAMVEWDFSGIDLSAVGLYYAKGNLPPPENTVFAQALNLPEISIPISVQTSGKPDINCMLAGRGNLYFPWVTPPGNLEEVSVWLSENNGPWICLEDGVYVGAEMLSIATRLLTYGSSYHLQADYDGGQTDRPDPIFYGKGLRHFGVELEIDSGGQDSGKASKLLAAANDHDPHLYIKTDGSLDDGLELVTYPMTLDYHLHQMPWEAVLQTARSLGYYSHRAGTCGLHVHISRTAFGITEQEQEASIARLVYFVEHFWTELLRFSRRTPRQVERWAARYGAKLTPEDTKKHLKNLHSNRYMAVNLTNTHTVEIRIFRGTLKLNTLLATLQFVNHLCDLAVCCDDAEVERLSWHDFIRTVREPELIQYLKERDLYVNEPVESEEDD